MNSGTVYPFSGVWGSSSRNLFAVGDGGTLFHYDGQTWSAMNSGTSLSLKAIWGSSSNDVFVVGDQGTILHYNGKDWSILNSGISTSIHSIWGSSSRDVFALADGGVILHYDGSSWKTMDSGTALPLSRIWGSSSSDVFAVGGGGILLHYDGSNWTPMEAGANYYLNDVWGSSSRDVFVVGNGDTILHYDGSLWNTMKRGDYVYLNDIWGTSSQDVFAIGNSNQVFHYDGNKWTTMNSGSPFYLKGIWGTSSSEVFAVGGRVGEGEIIQYDGNNWTGMDSGTTSNLNGIGGNSSSEVFTVGDNGTILRYDGSRWKPMTSGTSAKLTSIWSNSSREVFAVGDSGTILQYNGSRWATMNSRISANLSRVWGNAGNDVFAVGDKGTILHYDGQTWTAMDSGGTEARLTGVWGNSNVDVFASNWDGLILHYDGNRWTEMTEMPALLNGLWISPEGDAFAVGDAILYCANCQLGNSAIKVDPKLHNFWNIALGEINSQTFTISNTGSDKVQLKPLALTNATEFSLSNDTCSNAPIAPASTCQVDVNFQPQSVGTKITKLTLPSQTETLQIPIGGTGCSITFQQVFNPYPKSPNFGTVWVGNSMILNQTVNLTAIQGCGEELYIDKIEVVGEHAAEFSLREMTCDYSKAGIQSYSNCQFNIVFTPTSAGDKQAELTFKFLNHEDLPAPPLTIHASGHTQSRLGVSPKSHDFEKTNLGEITSQTFNVFNTGNIDAQLTQLALTDITEFSLNNDTCSNKPLAPTKTCQVSVNFQPQTEGIKSTKLTLPSTTETLQVPISGIGCSDTPQSDTPKQFFSYPEPNFGVTLVGDSLTLNQTVGFTAIQGCDEQLQIESIGVMGKNATEFNVKKGWCYNSNWGGKEYYSYCGFTTTFTPTSPGEKQAELIIKLSHAELPGHVIPLRAKAVTSGQARVELTPKEYDFGTILLNHNLAKLQYFIFKNTGELSLKMGNIVLVEEQPTEWWGWRNWWWCTNYDILTPGAQCDVEVQFSPTSAGQKQARLTVTAGNLTEKALLKGIAEEPKDCSDANITVKSAQSGRWDTPATWSTSKVPTATDVVRINQGHTVTGQAFAQVRTLCIQEGGVLESADEMGTPLQIQATDYLENKSVIRGKNGANQTKPTCSNWEIGTAGCAQPGANVTLKVAVINRGDWWWWRNESGGPILNTGKIIAGKGGDGSQYGAPGGVVNILGNNVTNTNLIQAGDGGSILGTDNGEGGQGGFTEISSRLGGYGHLYNQNSAKILSGNGGNCNNPQSQQTGGRGGNVVLISSYIYNQGGITKAGTGGKECTINGKDGDLITDPNVISLAGAATQVSGGNIAIYGGNDWTLDLSNLTGTVVEATGDITLAVGKDGLIDFRNSTGKILKANGEVQIFANNILLDPKKTVLDYIEAKNVVLGPSRLLRNVSLTGPGKLFGKPGDTLPIQLILANNGPEDDSYLVTATDSTGQNLGQLPQPVPVKGLETVNVEINTVVPATNPIILTATSQADPKTVATAAVFVEPAPVTTDNSIPNPNEPGSTQPDGSIKPSEPGTEGTGTVINPNEPSSGETGSNPNPEPPVVNPDAMVVVTPSLNTCPSTFGAIIDWMCLNHGQVLTDATLESNAKVAGGQLAGTIDNQGFVSQVTIQPDTILTGGKLSGYIVNQGTLRDFEFVGAQVVGGTLAGQVVNNSFMGGVFKDVHLAADTHLLGGYLQGEIQGDPAAPALLEDLTIQSGSHLAYVKIGKNVTWSAEVVFEDNVQFVEPTTYCNPTRLADIVPLLPRLDTMVLGKSIEVCSQFGGGLATDGKLFQQQLTVTRADLVEVMGRIAPDLRQVSQVVEWVLSAAYRAVETESPLYFMVDTQGKVLPWDGDVSDLVAFKEQVTLESVQSIRLYRGKFPAKGKLEIQFGYRLADGTVVLNAQPLEVMVLE
ncbi:glucosyltransferase-I precursor [Thioploca ingrica]|uniref:Glucosyltransferase-I n=1 Tax=Thioploca ingrica TaxID=40754 RepID=A0A090AMH6_9GAMM|nr:glucosyltransferase-I precursor [Thioploca ingrica]